MDDTLSPSWEADPMPISTRCPGCKAPFKFADEMAGKKARCQSCKQVFVIPTAAISATPLPPAPAEPVPILEPEPEPAPVPVELVPAAAVTAQPPALPLAEDEPARPTRRGAPPPPEDDDEDEARPRRERPAAKRGMTPLTIVLALVLLVYGGSIFACGGALGYLYTLPNPRQQNPWKQNPPRPAFKDKVFGDVGRDARPPDFKDAGPLPNQLFARRITLAGGQFETTDRLEDVDPRAPNNIGPMKVYHLPMAADRQYVVELHRLDGVFDPQLRLEDAGSRLVAEGKALPKTGEARLNYRPAATGMYQLLVTTRNGGNGGFTLSIREQKN